MPRRPGPPRPPIHAGLSVPEPVLTEAFDEAGADPGAEPGAWVRLRHGAYVPAATLSSDPYLRARQLALAHATAVVRQSDADPILSHSSAALAWGLPLHQLPTTAHVVQEVRRAGNAARDVVRHHRHATGPDRALHRGLPVTSLARTVVDCACTLGPRGGIVVADAAIAAGLTRQACTELLSQMRGARGVRTARAVLAAADDGAESPGESLTRLAVLAAGLPAPTTQVPVDTHLGVFWLDLGWPASKVGIEFDGAVKYGASPSEVLIREKRRQDALEEAGWLLIRLMAVDLRDSWAVALRVLRALRRRGPVDLAPRPLLGA